MNEGDLLFMLIGAYELGLKQGHQAAREIRDRDREWSELKDKSLADFKEMVTL